MNLSIHIHGDEGKLKLVVAADKRAVYELYGRVSDGTFYPIFIAMATLIENMEALANAQSD